MTGTHLFYNGVLMRGCELKQWRQEIVRDDSGTDVLYSRVTLSIESTLISLMEPGKVAVGGIAAPLNTMAIPLVANENVVDRYAEIRWRLQETRKDFWLAINAATSLPPAAKPSDSGYLNESYRVVLAAAGLTNEDLKIIEASSTATIGQIEGFHATGLGTPKLAIERKDVLDMNNGPKPLSVEVTQVYGGRSLRVRFSIEICRCFCKPVNPNSPETDLVPPVLDANKVTGVISNRWSLTDSMDEQKRTTHSIDGKLVVSDRRYKPHAMRLITTPKLFPYAKLTSRSFATDPSNLVLAYKFNIQEVGPAAPLGVADWSGTYTEQRAIGGRQLGTVAVRVTGYTNPETLAVPNAPDPLQSQKQKLVDIAHRIAEARIRWRTGIEQLPGSNPSAMQLQDIYVVEQMKEPVVELRLTVLYMDKAQSGDVVSDEYGTRLQNMGRAITDDIKDHDPDYDPKWWPNDEPFPWDVDSETEASESDDYGTYYDCYYQTPCSQWHSTPRGAIPPDSVQRDTGLPGNEPNGSTIAPLLYLDTSLTGDTGPGEPIPSDQHWWNKNQASFPYYQADIDTKYIVNSGRVQLPLSKPRYERTNTVIQLFQPVSQRVITMVATREGDWPKVPSPQTTIVNGGITETYLDGEILPDAPKLLPDGKTFLYSLQIRWVYAMSRPPNKGSDKLFAASNPMDRTTPQRNSISISSYFDVGSIEQGSGDTSIF